MAETLRLILTKFTDEVITVFSMFLLITMAGIIFYWFYNRKKFRQLTHEIPASVVKNYLDSIIQNSTALKSSLFRGGGLDIGNGIPSVVAISDLPSSSSINLEGLNQKNAEISALTLKLSDRTQQIQDLEKRLNELSSNKGPNAETDLLKKDVVSLKQELADAKASLGGGAQIKQELNVVSAERNELRERLKEYEIIEEDLANLKRLQQENDQLKAEIVSLKKGAPVSAPTPIPIPIPIPTPPPPPPAPAPVIEEEEVDLEAEMARAIEESRAPAKPAAAPIPESADEVPSLEGTQKSAEELLSEFEKMLG